MIHEEAGKMAPFVEPQSKPFAWAISQVLLNFLLLCMHCRSKSKRAVGPNIYDTLHGELELSDVDLEPALLVGRSVYNAQ